LNRRQITSKTIATISAHVNRDNFEIVKRWQMIESLAKRLMTEEDRQMSTSVSFLIRFLSHKIAKNEDDFLKLENYYN
jgi:hypothetical protein